MRNVLIALGIVFAGALAVAIVPRLTNEALAVVVGAVCGISACIPVSLALIIASSQSRGQGEARQSAPPQPSQILVVSLPAQPARQTGEYYLEPGADSNLSATKSRT